jgi:hypothetical protein
MSRSGYCDDIDDVLALGRWRGQVNSAIRGKRGQSFLKELATAMDSMTDKRLIANALIDMNGECCAIGAVCQQRSVEVDGVDYDEPEEVAKLVGIPHQMVAEIEWQNDENSKWIPRNDGRGSWDETPEDRWHRMREWVADNIIASVKEGDQ